MRAGGSRGGVTCTRAGLNPVVPAFLAAGACGFMIVGHRNRKSGMHGPRSWPDQVPATQSVIYRTGRRRGGRTHQRPRARPLNSFQKSRTPVTSRAWGRAWDDLAVTTRSPDRWAVRSRQSRTPHTPHGLTRPDSRSAVSNLLHAAVYVSSWSCRAGTRWMPARKRRCPPLLAAPGGARRALPGLARTRRSGDPAEKLCAFVRLVYGIYERQGAWLATLLDHRAIPRIDAQIREMRELAIATLDTALFSPPSR
jgi:hypothetical protein